MAKKETKTGKELVTETPIALKFTGHRLFASLRVTNAGVPFAQCLMMWKGP